MNHASRTLTDALLDPILKNDPAGPRVTFYDDATGERIELSALTLANWAAKTANLLRDEFGLEPGARVAVLLPAHWQSAAVLLGCWWAGAEVRARARRRRRARARHGRPPGRRRGRTRGRGAVAGRVRQARPDLPVGVTDYATSVRVHGDQFRPVAGARRHWTAGRSPTCSPRHGLRRSPVDRRRGSRALELRVGLHDELIDGLLAVLAAGASLVQVAPPTTR